MAYKRGAGEGAADEPDVALRHPEGVPNVAGAVAVHVARLGVGELATLPQLHIELGYDERISDVSLPIGVGKRARWSLAELGRAATAHRLVGQISGPTMDVEFESGHLPQILNAIHVRASKAEWGADIDVTAQIAFHRKHGRKATVTAVRQPTRFGALHIDGDRVSSFAEKPPEGGRVNGGFFLVSPSVGPLIAGDTTAWEREPLEALARTGELAAYIHDGFWHPMDTLRDRNFLEEQWASGRAPWKRW